MHVSGKTKKNNDIIFVKLKDKWLAYDMQKRKQLAHRLMFFLFFSPSISVSPRSSPGAL